MVRGFYRNAKSQTKIKSVSVDIYFIYRNITREMLATRVVREKILTDRWFLKDKNTNRKTNIINLPKTKLH